MKTSLKRHISNLLIIMMLAGINVAYAVPFNWTISNAGESDEYYIKNEAGIELSTFLIQLIEDVDGDGSDLPDINGNPQDDDLLLTSIEYDVDVLDLPNGVFSLATTLYSEVTPFNDQTEYYIRVFNESEIAMGSFYSESYPFHSPSSSLNTQTNVSFHAISGYYIGNEPPVFNTVEDQVAEIGDIQIIDISAVDDEALNFDCISDDIPGGPESVTISPLSDLSAQVQWQIPIDAQGNHSIRFTATDGQFTDTVTVDFNVSDVSGVPTAFHLLSPNNHRSLFDGLNLSWQESISPSSQNVFYNLYWSLNEDFIDLDSIVGIDTTAIHYVFYEEAAIPNRLRSRIELFEDNSSTTTSSLDELVDFSPALSEGTRIYWKIKAYHEGTAEERWSVETFNAYLEIPEAPSSSVLIHPVTDDTIRTATPEFNWSRAFDPDMGDEISYNLVYSTDNFLSFDTIKAIPDTFYNIHTNEIQHEQNSGDIYSSIWGIIKSKIGLKRNTKSSSKTSSFTSKGRAQLEDISPVRDYILDDHSLAWWVEAVDTYPLRTSSDTSFIFVEIPEHPEEFDLVFPADSQLFAGPRDVSFQWTPSFDTDPEDNVTYDLLITWDAEIEVPEDFEIVFSGITQNRFTYTDEIQDDSSLKWTVRTISGEDTIWAKNNAEAFNTCYFSHQDAPTDFVLMSPNGRFIGDEPLLVWSASNETDLFDSLSYSLLWTRDNWVNTQRVDGITDTITVLIDDAPSTDLNSDDGILSSKGQKSKTVKNASSQLDEFEDGEVIAWKIIASDTQGHKTSALPETGFSFTVDYDDPPLPFDLVRPYNEELIFAPAIEFKWESTTDPDGLDTMRYQIQIADNPDFNDMLSFNTLTDTSIVISITDWDLGEYWWRVEAVDETGSSVVSNTVMFEVMATEVSGGEATLPEEFTVRNLYPNPFNSTINISFAVPVQTQVTLQVFDILGRVVSKKSTVMSPGYTTIPFDFKDNASGVYFVRVKQNNSIHSVHKIYLQK